MTLPADVPPLPDLVLWRTEGCHLCEETAGVLRALLRERARDGRSTPRLVERLIATDAAVERELFAAVPVLEIGPRRLPEAVHLGPIRAFLAAAYDAPAG